MNTTEKPLKLGLGIFLMLMLSYFISHAQNGLSRGSLAPNFKGITYEGKFLTLKSILKNHNYAILVFYRGQWCPYCNKHLSDLQDSLSLLEKKGAFVLAISPETNENIGLTKEKTKVNFAIMHDKDYKIMKAYDVQYTVDPGTLVKFKSYGINLEKNNGNKDNVLPVPATYIISKNQTILRVDFNKDYRKRISVKDLLESL